MNPIGLINKLFGKKPNDGTKLKQYFETINSYTPSFTSFSGGVYEAELTRSAIHAFATHCSKLKPEISGAAKPWLNNALLYRPNPFMDTTKFLYRLATILSVDTTAFIIPIYDQYFEKIVGIYPLPPSSCELVKDYNENLWIRYTFGTGKRAAIEFSNVGIMTTHTYADEFFGSGNYDALRPTLQLMSLQNKGIQEAIKRSPTISFMGRIGQVVRPEDLKKERKEFAEMNLSAENDTGVMIFDAKYADVKQIVSKPYVADPEQMKLIQTNVYNYFGVNEKILQNSFNESEWNAFYEGKIEPFALQLSLVLSNLLYSEREIASGNSVTLTSNRLQYASNETKLNVSTQLFDRSILRVDDVMDIWNLPRIGGEAGQARYIRLEYTNLEKDGKVTPNANTKNAKDTTGQDPKGTGVQEPDNGPEYKPVGD